MFIRKHIIFVCVVLLLPLLPAYFLSGTVVHQDKLPENDPYRKKISELSQEGILWIDARSKEKFEQKHIPGAMWVSAKDWEAVLAQLFEVFQPGQTIVVYCNKGCAESRGLAERLRQALAQENVYYLEGGVDSWFSNTPR